MERIINMKAYINEIMIDIIKLPGFKFCGHNRNT